MVLPVNVRVVCSSRAPRMVEDCKTSAVFRRCSAAYRCIVCNLVVCRAGRLYDRGRADIGRCWLSPNSTSRGGDSVMTGTRSSLRGSANNSGQGVEHPGNIIFRAISWVVRTIRRFMCGFMGHENVLWFERDRLSLRCISCGHQSRGWTIGDATPERAERSTAQSPRMEPRRAA